MRDDVCKTYYYYYIIVRRRNITHARPKTMAVR